MPVAGRVLRADLTLRRRRALGQMTRFMAGVESLESVGGLPVCFLVQVRRGVQPLARALDDPAALAEHLAGDLHAPTEQLGHHGADAGAVTAGVGDQVLAGGLQFLPTFGQFAAELAELAARPAQVIGMCADLAHAVLPPQVVPVRHLACRE